MLYSWSLSPRRFLTMHPNANAVDEKQRSPLLEFYLWALAFAGALVLMEYSQSLWREILRFTMIALAGFAVWALLRFLRVADERQRRSEEHTSELQSRGHLV